MFYLLIFMLMFFLPISSIGIEYFAFHNPNLVFLIGKWFVFWAIGIRVFTAASRQIIRPEFTAKDILGMDNKNDFIIVRELGFSNMAIGTIAIVSLFIQNWIPAAALAGCIFLGFAGINHIFRRPVNSMEWIVLSSDLFVSFVLAIFLVLSAI